MPTLKTKTVTNIQVDYRDLDEFINAIYGGDYECVAYEEWGNDSSHEYEVKPEILHEYDQGKIAALRAGRPNHYCLGTILIDLCNNGHISPGQYLISVSW